MVAAAAAAGARVVVSTGTPLPGPVADAVRHAAEAVHVEDDEAWLARVRALGGGRVRLVGAAASSLAAATGGRPDLAVWDHPVTESGRVEALPFVREQAVSVTAHRFGTPNHLTDAILPVG